MSFSLTLYSVALLTSEIHAQASRFQNLCGTQSIAAIKAKPLISLAKMTLKELTEEQVLKISVSYVSFTLYTKIGVEGFECVRLT